ncbi:hypothetical protein OHA79_09565 [Streptomyces sp. NBC_00841]|uniref:hypothetical protein n=1 Tax=Streptomyces sp. NBC_00841 TaxID=2975847 RepID=UPI002DD8F91A|nr:hypothetical protein [Streptomyces sp. NBC_00841]WRZ98062.1 hypothetical protein OHA79_09565 [Streptomyces sp. NBC_00841]
MPLTDARGQAIPYSTLSDKPNAQTLGQAIVDAVADKVVMTFNSATVRGGTIPAPKAGMVSYLKDTKLIQVYDGTTWQTMVAATLPWANVTLSSTYKAYAPGSTVGPRVRREGSIVYLEGRLMRTDGANIPAGSDSLTIGTVPSAYRPSGHYAEGFCTTSNAGTGTPLARVEVWHTDGTIRLWTDRATTFIGFSSWWFVN